MTLLQSVRIEEWIDEMMDRPTPDYTTDRARWEAVQRRDASARGAFIYAVTTTGIYCQPGCSSKLPSAENVRFFETWQQAEQAGFRACKRCQPQTGQPAEQREAILRACQQLESAAEMPTLEDLARAAHLSPSHFHRLFRRVVGVTPKQYFMQKRLARVQEHLRVEETITGALYEAGYGSSSAFYEDAENLGMQPSAYRKGGAGERIQYTLAESYLGWALVAATEKGICAIELGDTPEELTNRLRARFPQAKLSSGDPQFSQWAARALAHLESPRQGGDLPLDIQGTAFQRRVWQELREIPAGETASYTQIAAQIGAPKAVRAVASACASNKIAVVIPCHRVLRADGSLGGYRWGLARKQRLLDRERKEKG